MNKWCIALGGVLALVTYTDVQAGLISYWPFDTATSGVTPDAGAAGNHAALVGNASITTDGTRGMVASLDGADDLINAGTSTTLDFGSGNFTLSGWVKTSQTTRASLMYRNDAVTPFPGYQLEINANSTTAASRILIDNGPVSSSSTDGLLNNGQWHHIAAVIDGIGQTSGTVTLYIDGVPQTSGSLSGLTTPASLSPSVPVPFTMGGRWNSNDTFPVSGIERELNGLMDDMAVWDVALPLSSIQGLANGTYTPPTAPVPEPLSSISLLLGAVALLPVRIWRRGLKASSI
jgi:hypothetical protein